MAAGTTGRPPRRRSRGDLTAPLLPGRGPLARVPAVAAFAVVTLVFATAVIIGGPVGVALLAALVVAVVALLAATWSRLGPGDRLGRLVVLGVLLLVMVGLVTGAGR